MRLQPLTHKTTTTLSPTSSTSNFIKRIWNPIKEATIRLLKEEPLTASGTFLTIGALTAAVFSMISRTALKFMPIFGIPACLIFGYKLFTSYLETRKLFKEEKELQNKEKLKNPLVFDFSE